MKRKFLSLALVSALFAFAITGVVTAQSEGALSEAEVSVTAHTTLTIAVAGELAAHTCTGIVAGVANDSCTATLGVLSTDYVEVVDYTGMSVQGHKVTLNFDTSSWTYDRTDTNYPTYVAVAATTSGSDRILYYIEGPAAPQIDYDTRTGATCTPRTEIGLSSGIVQSKREVLSSGSGAWIINGNECQAKWQYAPEFFQGLTGTNGLGIGAYTISATWTLTDGKS